MSSYREGMTKLADYRRQIEALHGEMRKVQAKIDPQPVEDYVFTGQAGPMPLSKLFGDKKDLFIIHNMGTSCPYCTLWADGFNGVYDHLANRAAFVVSSPDAPSAQKQFAASRNWRFPMVSHQGTNFAADMGYRREGGGWNPGVSVFQRGPKGPVRVSDAPLGPGDDFCSVWHFLDLLPEGAAQWQPKFRYG
ncbi:MAG TPA: DUF899 family protein [Stellaceae bacterium]|nr:DUF899 family protein [Stellaceae bacterium]